MVGRYFGLLAVTLGYHWLPALPGFGMCACNMWLDVSLGYLQLLQVTIGYQRYQVLGMCACNMWFVSLAVRFLVNVFLGTVLERVLHTSDLPLGC